MSGFGPFVSNIVSTSVISYSTGSAYFYVTASTNNTTAIQTALTSAAAAGGGTVMLGPGLHTFDQIYISTNVTLTGTSRMATHCQPTGTFSTGDYWINLASVSARDVVITDLYLDGQNAENLGAIELLNEGVTGDTRHRIINCNIRYFRESGGNAAVLWGHHARDGLIYGCDIRDTSVGVACEGSDFTIALTVIAGSRDGPNLVIPATPNVRVIGVKCFYAGYNYDDGTRYPFPNFHVYGSRNTAFVACESQDAGGHGFQIGSTGQTCSDVTLAGCISEASNAASSGSDAYHIVDASRVTFAGSISKNTVGLSGQQDYGIGFSGTNTSIDLTGAGSQQGTSGSVEATVINSGLTMALVSTVSWNPPTLSSAASQTTTITVTGAKLADKHTVQVGFSLDQLGTTLTGYVSADNTVTVVHQNPTTASVNLGTGNLYASVYRFA